MQRSNDRAREKGKTNSISGNLYSASLCDSPFSGAPRGHSASTRAGLAYEKKVAAAIVKSNHFPLTAISRNPWFLFEDDNGTHYCSPDLLLSLVDGNKIIIEVKLGYKLEAETKLKTLYYPVVSKAFNWIPGLLIIAKRLTADAPEPAILLQIDEILRASCRPTSRVPVIQWLGKGPI